VWKLALGTLLAVIAIVVWHAPAALMRELVERVPDAHLASPRGTIWRGSGQLILAAGEPHELSWTIDPIALLGLEAVGDYRLDGPAVALTGQVAWGARTAHLSVAGTARPAAIAPILAAHELNLEGEVDIAGLEIALAGRRIESIDGVARWSGGTVGHALGGTPGEAWFGPVTATIGTGELGPKAIVKHDADDLVLLEVELRHDGFVRVGVTKGLTKMLNRPWPGSGPDAAVVFQVEEKIYGFQ
jgi:hypothetical protein